MTSRPSIGRIRIGLLNTMFSASSSLTWAGVGLPDSRSLRKGCIWFSYNGSRPQRFERRAHFTNEQLWLFPRREVSAFGKTVVVDKVHIRFLGPALRRLINFLRKRAHGDRKLDASHVEETAAWRKSMPRVPVETGGRDRGIRQPIERDVVEHVVSRQSFRLTVENAGDHLVTTNVVIEYPARKADRRIDDSVQSLRTVIHLESVAQPVRVEVNELIPRMFFIRREAGGRRATHRKGLRNIGWNRCRHIGVNGEQSRRLLQSHHLRN